MMKLDFEWDDEKAKENKRKHKVDFEEAVAVFSDPFSLTIEDPDHSIEEPRYIDLGRSESGRVLVVSYTESGAKIRIITCRRASRSEGRRYEEGIT
jgi:uncharacterized DUF497 family protein